MNPSLKNHGCAALTSACGANVVIIKEEMTRAPAFRVQNVQHGQKGGEMAPFVVG